MNVQHTRNPITLASGPVRHSRTAGRTRLRRALAAGVLVAGSLGTGMLAVPTAASAAAQACTIHIGTTVSSGTVIDGHGSLGSGCASGVRARITIWRSRFFPLNWEPMSTTVQTGPGLKHVYYDCQGTGTHDFQTTINVGSQWLESNTITKSC